MAYRPTAVSNDVVQGEPLRRVANINVASDLRATEAWWWEAGPVHSCCCCFSLRTGVGILAGLDFLALRSWVAIFSISLLSRGIAGANDFLHEQAQISYKINCEGETKILEPAECAEIAQQLLAGPQEVGGVPAILYVEVAVSVIFGAIGLWAVFCSDARAAKWYLWTWLPRYLVEVATAFVGGWTVLYSYVFSYWLFWFLYYTKVVWSYQEVLKRRTYRASFSGSTWNVGGGVELSTSRGEGSPGSSTHLV